MRELLNRKYEQEAGEGLNAGQGGGGDGLNGAGKEGDGDELAPEVQELITAATAKLNAKNQQLIGLNKRMSGKMEEMEASNNSIMDKMRDEEERKMIEAGDIDTVVTMRSQKQLNAKDEKIRELELMNQRNSQDLNMLRVADMARDAAIAVGILPQATEEVRLLVGSYFKMEDGKPVGYRNGEEMLNEKGETLTMSEFIQQMATTKPYLFQRHSGAGARGGNAQSTGAKRSEMTMEQKSEYVSQHGQEAYEKLTY